MKTLIIGNGITGVTAALTVRELQPDWDITIVSEESDHFFSRTALMYIYMGHMRVEDTRPYEQDFWRRKRLKLVRATVTGIDAAARLVKLGHGTGLAYDKLLIATGSQSNKFGWPGQDLEGVQGLYHLQDLERLEARSAGIRRGIIVGGGLIGIELAEMLRFAGQAGHDPGAGIVLLEQHPSPGGIGTDQRGDPRERVDLRLNSELREIVDDGTGQVCAVVTGGGERIECQFVG